MTIKFPKVVCRRWYCVLIFNFHFLVVYLICFYMVVACSQYRNGIGNYAISLSKEFSGKNGSKLAQRSPTNTHADVKKINNWKCFLGPIRGLQNTRPKNFRKPTRASRIHLDAIKTHNFPDNTDQLLTPTRSDTYCFLSGAVFVWSSNNGVMLQFQVG